MPKTFYLEVLNDAVAPTALRSNTGSAVLSVHNQDVGPNGAGISSDAPGLGRAVIGRSRGGTGVDGISSSGAGVHGYSATKAGVEGSSTSGVGVQGYSTTSRAIRGNSSKNIGIEGFGGLAGVYGWSQKGAGVVGMTLNARDYAGYFWGSVYVNGSLIVAPGKTKHVAVPHPDGTHRLLYTMESPECWFEDFGTAKLVRGRAKVKLDRDFAAMVRTNAYHVFLTPEGDSNGLFVASKGRAGFEVREQLGGRSSVRFSYRVVAKRRDTPAPRLPKVKLPKVPVPVPRG